MGGYKAVLFDLDGTLLNTNNLVLQSFKHTFQKHLSYMPSDEELFSYFGEPLHTTMLRYDSSSPELLLKTYRAFNLENHDRLTTIFPGAKECLQVLKEKGIKIAIVTSKIRTTVQKGLHLFDLEELVDLIVGPEDTEKHKPNPEPVLKALELLRVDKDAAMMVGDSPFDLQSAKKAGVTAVAVGWSVFPREVLQKAEPDYLIADFQEVINLCQGPGRHVG